MAAFLTLFRTACVGYLLYTLVVVLGLVSGEISLPLVLLSVLGLAGIIPTLSKRDG